MVKAQFKIMFPISADWPWEKHIACLVSIHNNKFFRNFLNNREQYVAPKRDSPEANGNYTKFLSNMAAQDSGIQLAN